MIDTTRVRRTLGRTSLELPPVVWECGTDTKVSEEVLRAACQVGLHWFILPMASAADVLARGDVHAIIRMEIEEAVATATAKVIEKFKAMERKKIAGVMLCGATGGDIKAGRAFHRLATLRDAGLCDTILVEATDPASAEWLVDNSPIGGISLPYDLTDQNPRYRVLPAATALCISVLGRASSAAQSPADVRMRLDDEQVAASIEPFPRDLTEFSLVNELVDSPVDKFGRECAWSLFTNSNPEPAKPRGQHPPEFE